MHIAGLDLAAKEDRCSGFAVIRVNKPKPKLIFLKCLSTDYEIIGNIIKYGISLVAIDAPITPKPIMREVDRVMIKSGFKVFPPSFSWMKRLSQRAYNLYLTLRDLGIKIIETHPKSALISSRVNNVGKLCNLLGISIEGYEEIINRSKDLRDALISALVAYCYVMNTCVKVVKARDGEIYLIRELVISANG
ncbi:MAG: hypothetical protein B6U85_03945 [Desulfurococcales archaeon ex4484_42]|nr:MAG: hypothetical protein B6U85_03945 [Desulfurococcales archaeon ex4484_42]